MNKGPHFITAPDGATYPCTCPIIGDHPLLTATPEQYVAMVSQGFVRLAPITDAQVEAAAQAIKATQHVGKTWDAHYRAQALAALEAVREASTANHLDGSE